MSKQKLIVLAGGLCLLFVVGAIIAARLYFSTPEVAVVETVVQSKPQREVAVYLIAGDGDYLLPEIRNIDECDAIEACLRGMIAELSTPSTRGAFSPIPKGTKLIGITLADGIATLNFSRELVNAHPGGSSGELLTVYAVANTLAGNFPDIKGVQFLVEGETVETLRGHVDLRKPVSPDLRFNQPPEPIRKERKDEKEQKQ